MKIQIVIIMLILLFSITTVTASALVNQDQIVDGIAKSIREHPEQWLDTGARFIHCEDPDKMKRLKEMTWPEQDAKLVLIYHFQKSLTYVHLKKPFEYSFEGDLLKKLIQEMKIYKLNVLQKEVGHLLNRKKKVEKKSEIKEEQINEDGLKKL